MNSPPAIKKTDLSSSKFEASHNNCDTKKWKPSILELIVLESSFQKDQSPEIQDQKELLKQFQEKFGINISLEQLNDWFEEERNKPSKRLKSENSYVKLTAVELRTLEENFELNNYPKVEEMQKMAEQFKVRLSKIENWYKHRRRMLAKRGLFDIKPKKTFKASEKDYLISFYRKTPKPTQKDIEFIADQLGCTELQIKNWYSNKRKKARHLCRKTNSNSLTEFYESNPPYSAYPPKPEGIAPDLVEKSSGFASKDKNPSYYHSNAQRQDNSVFTQSFKHENPNSFHTQTLQPDLPKFQALIHPPNLRSGFIPIALSPYYQIQDPNLISSGLQGILINPIPTSTQTMVKHQDQAVFCFQPVDQMGSQSLIMPNLGLQTLIFQRENNKINPSQEYSLFNSCVKMRKDVDLIKNDGVAKNYSSLN